MRRGVWGCQDFPSKVFLSHCAKFFAVETFCDVIQKTSGSENFKDKRRVIKIFHRQNFCLTVPKNFVGEHFCAAFEKISVGENVYG